MAVAILGTSLGDTISYFAGRLGWRRALDRAEQLPFMSTVRSALMRRTGLFVLAYHFLGYTRLLGPVTAGALRIPFRRWYILDTLGATAWVTVFMIGGYALGGVVSLETLDDNIKVVDRVLLVGAVVTVGVIVLLRMRAERRRKAAAQADADEPIEETSPTPLP
jgi:membrane protein DedA with SNARE-associated domain